MSSRVLAGLLAAGCVTAAAGGGYIAVRQNAATPVPVSAAPAPAVPAPEPAGRPVAETEAVVGSSPEADPAAMVKEHPAPSVMPKPAAAMPHSVAKAPAPPKPSAAAARRAAVPPTAAPTRARDTAPTPAAAPSVAPPAPSQSAPAAPMQSARAEPAQERTRTPEPPAPAVPEFEEVVLPASSVIGLEVDTALSSERARVEDRVDARVTRDVMADGRVAIPAGSRVLGAVTLVERGGKVKEAARLGVRFHTVVLTNGREVPLSTEPVYREGESPAGDSARKIGGAAVGGAILGAIIGGGKGAMIGGATGAAGGSAVVMSGDRRAATLPSGSVVTVRLSGPATIEVERREQ